MAKAQRETAAEKRIRAASNVSSTMISEAAAKSATEEKDAIDKDKAIAIVMGFLAKPPALPGEELLGLANDALEDSQLIEAGRKTADPAQWISDLAQWDGETTLARKLPDAVWIKLAKEVMLSEMKTLAMARSAARKAGLIE